MTGRIFAEARNSIKLPEDSCTGYPFVYLYDGKDATEITGPLSLDVIDSCIENIEEGDIE